MGGFTAQLDVFNRPKLKNMLCFKTQDFLIIYRQNQLMTIDDFYSSFSSADWMLILCASFVVCTVGVFISMSLILFGHQALTFHEYGMVSLIVIT